MKVSKKTAVITALVAMSLLLSACAATAVTFAVKGSNSTGASSSDSINYGASSTNAVNANEKVTYVGKFEVTSTMPVVSVDGQNSIPLVQWKAQTWYVSDTDNLLPGTMGLSAKVIDRSSDLNGMEARVRLPDGRIVYARNFKISYATDTGASLLDAEHDGIRNIVIQDENGDSASYKWDNRPIALPSKFEGKPIIIVLTVKANR